MKHLIYLIFILILMTSFVKEAENSIWFPHEIGIIENCEENEILMKFDLETNSKKKIQVHTLQFNNQNFTLIVNGVKRSLKETLFISSQTPLHIEIKYKRTYNTSQGIFRFKTSKEEYLENNINIKYGAYNITSESVRNGKECVINYTKNCNDSLTIHFPYGGTISGATLYKDSIKLDIPYKSISYGMMDEKNYLKFSKADIGSYYVRFGACHWGNEFWLTIK